MSKLKQFPLPDVGEGLTEAEILSWHILPGDTVAVNQIIVEIETAKAAVELPCPYAGVVTELHAQPGDTVYVGAPIVTIDLDPAGAADVAPSSQGKIGEEMPGGRIATLVGYGPRAAAAKRRPRKTAERPVPTDNGLAAEGLPPKSFPPAQEPPRQAVADADLTVGDADAGPVPLAKPPVRKLAKELGVDLRRLAGSGPSGVITRDDVQRAAAPEPELVETARPPYVPAYDPTIRERRVPIRGVRRATAAAMVDSAFTAPHVTEFLAVDVTPMMDLRARLLKSPEFLGVKLTPLAFAAKAACLAIRRNPDVNATWDGTAGEIVYKDYVHLGIAVATARGLIVPKLRDADQMSLLALAEDIDDLTATARDGKTPPASMLNGTFTITNVGVFGIDTGTPIINPGESAILALGAIRDMPWVVDGQVVPRKICQLSLSFDHRVVDGQQGSQFLADVGAILADPARAIIY